MRGDDDRLDDIAMAAATAVRFTEGRTRSDLDSDEMLLAALLHQITVIGEAAQSLTTRRRLAMPGIPWRQIIGMRTILVHAYWRIDRDEIWHTVSKDLPGLLAAISTSRTETGA
jgi:uncharacterized protein with HEPN domain